MFGDRNTFLDNYPKYERAGVFVEYLYNYSTSRENRIFNDEIISYFEDNNIIINKGIGIKITDYNTYDTSCESDVVIPRTINGYNVVEISKKGFYYNYLTSLSLPNSVMLIDEYAYEGNSLSALTIPKNLIIIGNESFCDNQLTSITIPNNVIRIDMWGAFADNRLTNVVFEENSRLRSIGDKVFRGAYITEVNIPDTVNYL